MPLSFELNQGQTNEVVHFFSRGAGHTLWLTSDEAVLAQRAIRKPPKGKSASSDSSTQGLDVFRLKFANANPHAQIEGLEELPSKTNYFIGNDPKKWRTNVPGYAKVRYRDVYPGVDLVYYGNETGQLEYDFVVAPGADPLQIALDVQSGLGPPESTRPESARLTANGDLILRGSVTDLCFQKPVIYQQDDRGQRHLIAGQYSLQPASRDSKNQNSTISFEIASYDHSKPLIIDPTITYSTYLGGSAFSIGNSVAVYTDAATSHVFAYVAGGTCDVDFPTKSAWQSVSAGGGCAAYVGEETGDAFVAKIDPSATGAASLVWSTYLGGGDNAEFTSAIAVDSVGNVYLTGNTNSVDFPTANAFQLVRKSPPSKSYYPATAADAFLSKLSSNGSTLLYSTYFGGSNSEYARAIALDAFGRAYIAGQTTSPDLPTVNPYQATLRATGGAAFVAVFDTMHSGVSSLVYSTYLGGSGTYYHGDAALGIAIEAGGIVHLGGAATSPDFPIVNGFATNFLSVPGSEGMGFYAKLNPFAPASSQLVYSSFLGPSGGNGGLNGVTGVAVDATGSAYVVGDGIPGQVPITPGAYQNTNTGDAVAFIAKINPTLSGQASLIYCASLSLSQSGGGANATGIAVDAAGNAFVVGHAGPGLPLVNPVQNASNGVFQSLDAGATWAGLTKGLADNYVGAFAIDTSTSPRTLYAGTRYGAIYASTDGGLNWNHVLQLQDGGSSNECSGSNTPCVFALVVDPVLHSTVYAGTSSGVYRSTDRGATWTTLNSGLSSTAAQGLIGLQVDGGALYAAGVDGLYKLASGASTWTATNLTSEVRYVTIDAATSPHTIYAFTSSSNAINAYAFKSINGGMTWTPFGDLSVIACLRSLSVDTTTSPSTLYASQDPLCSTGYDFAKSTDGGNTWANLDVLEATATSNSDSFSSSIVVDTTRTPSIVYIKDFNDGLMKSTDGGSTWTRVTKGGGPGGGRNGFIALDPTTATTTSPANLYVGSGSPLMHLFVVELNTSGSALLFSTYISGVFGEERTFGNGIALDPAGNFYVTGSTSSKQIPVVNAFQSRYPAPAFDSAFFARIGDQTLPTSSSTPVSTQVGVPIGTLTVSLPNISGSTTNSAPKLAVSPLSSSDTGNFSLSDNLGAYDISTTATYSASTSNPITLCFQAQTVNDLTTFNGLRLIHIVNGIPVDSTSSRDFATRTVCGSVTSLSPFILINGTPAVSWSNPQSIVYGARLSSTQLNATANVPGSFTYSPASGTVLGPGQQTLSVTFTPSNLALYSSVTRTNKINVMYSTASCGGDLGHTVLQPINADGSSVFKLGSTVPTKFRVCDVNGVPVGLPGTVASYTLIGAGTASGLSVDEDVYSTSSDSAFRWDSVGKQWIFNQGTGKNNPTLSQTNTVYRFGITLRDGSSIQFQYGLK